MKKHTIKAILGTIIIMCSMVSISACTNTSNNTSSISNNTESITDTIKNSSSKNEETPNLRDYRLIVDDSFLDTPFAEQYKNNNGFLTQSMYDHSVLIKAYDGYITKEDQTNAESSDPSKKVEGQGVLIIAKNKDNINELNKLTVNKDFSETTIDDGEHKITVKTALNYKNELYIVMNDNIVAIQDYIQ